MHDAAPASKASPKDHAGPEPQYADQKQPGSSRLEREPVRRLPLMLAPAMLALTLGLLCVAAKADMASEPARPSFSANELALIERNQSLKEALDRAPWLVRRALQEIADEPPETTRGVEIGEARPLQMPKDFDAGHDPDLESFQRVSPEAAHDLFQLLKKASNGEKKAIDEMRQNQR